MAKTARKPALTLLKLQLELELRGENTERCPS